MTGGERRRMSANDTTTKPPTEDPSFGADRQFGQTQRPSTRMQAAVFTSDAVHPGEGNPRTSRVIRAHN